MSVEAVTEPLPLGEAPHWDERQQALYFVSILDKTIHKYDYATRVHTKTQLEGRPGFILPVEGTSDQFVVGLERRFVVLRWDGAEGSPAALLREMATVDERKPGNRINDGKADPKGRLFAGSLGPEDAKGFLTLNQGTLYRLDGAYGYKPKGIATCISCSNGLAWDLKEKAFYYIDSPEMRIRRYDYDVDTGKISNMTHCFNLNENNLEGHPDGATVDTDGNLWVAVFGGSCVIHVDPRTGKLLKQVSIPAIQVTSLTFGGPNLDILFVTSARVDIKGVQLTPTCGSTFMVQGLGVKGLKNVCFKYSE